MHSNVCGGHFYLAFYGPCGFLQTKIFHIVFVLFSQKSISHKYVHLLLIKLQIKKLSHRIDGLKRT